MTTTTAKVNNVQQHFSLVLPGGDNVVLRFFLVLPGGDYVVLGVWNGDVHTDRGTVLAVAR